jgi:predicted N-acyltransferase
MQRAVDADAAELHRFGGSGDIAFRHKHHKDRQLAEGDLLVDIVLHSPSTLLVCFSFSIQISISFMTAKLQAERGAGGEWTQKGKTVVFPFVHFQVCFYSAISCCGEASR